MPQHCLCGRATELPQLGSTGKTSMHCQAGLMLPKKDNYTRY